MPKSAWALLLFPLVVASSAALALTAGDSAPSPRYLNQGWSSQIRQLFYHTPEGSRMMPYDWFMALESAGGQEMFAATTNLERYGFLKGEVSPTLNPGGLPIGFAIDPANVPERGRFVGLTCAACHTTDIDVGGQRVRIDGAPALIDFDRFYADLAATVKKTFFDGATFQRFSQRVLPAPDPAAIAKLRQQFAQFEAAIAGDAAIRRSSVVSGFGRVDALTQIVNALSVTDQAEPRNLRDPGAPTRVTPLWLTPELEFVQRNPIAASPIGRNGGEALGVFGVATLTSGGPPLASSVLIRELGELESWIEDLKPPSWDESLFGPIDRRLATAGAPLFAQHCASCHNAPPYRTTDAAANYFGKTFIAIGRVDYRAVGTDPAYNEALLQRNVYTNSVTAPLFGGQPVVPGVAYFANVVGAILKDGIDKLGLSDAEKARLDGYRMRPASMPGGPPRPYAPPSVSDLKAGPLPGIWASGPYLHNGSVATIDELLSPVAQRRSVFWTGGHELDPKRLGYVSDEAPNRFRFDTNLPANHNTGHLYPAQGLTPAERAAIIEFLKTL